MANWVSLPLTSGRAVHVNLDAAHTIEQRAQNPSECTIWFGGMVQSELHVKLPADEVLRLANPRPQAS
jgi:hypothetical protein